MNENSPADLEHDPRFPSGPWTGFFLQYWFPGRHTTNLGLTCRGGELAGEGQDWVGPYSINGSYDVGSGRCEWIKKYFGKHSVAYRGMNDGHGIWGVWEIRQLGGLYVDRGGFHLWPEGTDVSEESDRTERALMEVMHREFGNRSISLLRTIVALATVTFAVGLLVRWLWSY